MHLERKLARRPELLEQLRASIAHAERRVELAGIGDAQVLAALARAYTQTVSILQPRIMVSGEPARLRDDAVADQVRALLLAAMRSTVLWRQCGGNRIGLLFGRKRLARLAQQILSEPDL
jgi:high frequency lysogenization protein